MAMQKNLIAVKTSEYTVWHTKQFTGKFQKEKKGSPE